MDPNVLNAMVLFVYVAIIKDALVGCLTYGLYLDQGKDFIIRRIKTDF